MKKKKILKSEYITGVDIKILGDNGSELVVHLKPLLLPRIMNDHLIYEWGDPDVCHVAVTAPDISMKFER